MRIQNSLVRGGVLCGLTLGACLVGIKPAAAEVTLVEKDGWTFFTDGRVNSFVSQGWGQDFPDPTPNPNLDANGQSPTHEVLKPGQPSAAGFVSGQGDANGKYNAMRVRSGFMATIIGFGMRQQLTPNTGVKAYISLWGTAQTFARDRRQDVGSSYSKGFDVREGYVGFDGRWGSLVAGRQLGIFGGISTQINFLYAHNNGLGLPCQDIADPACGHIGTGALGPGFAAGFVYTTPSLGGLKLQAGLFDPVRLLGAWERVPMPRPEGSLSFERKFAKASMVRLVAEGMYQPMAMPGIDRTDKVWGVAAGGRLELGPVRLGLAAFRGKGLGVYVALQNSPSSFSQVTNELRYFTGLYGQTALVFGKMQVSLGGGRVIDDQLPVDKTDATLSGLKTQTGASVGLFYTVSGNLVVGLDYFRFQTEWWGAPNSMFDDTGAIVILPGTLPPEKQLMQFINAGATFQW